jgi:ribosome biogenesis GTPase / thiamine phosphate phosphatase
VNQALPEEGLVLSHLGQALAVEDGAGRLWLCQTRRQIGAIAVGDRVTFIAATEGLGRVESILERKSLLTRPAHAGRIRPVAANLDQVMVVVAPEPEPDWLLVDQYTAAAAHRHIDLAIIINKIDRVEDWTALDSEMAQYRKMGYPCHPVSAKSEVGLPGLRDALKGRTSILSGQSGVGKSSLTNALLPGKNLKTRELSEKAGLGRHTTTAAMLYHLPDGGDLIDSPGVAVFGLAEINAEQLAYGYVDFRPFLDRCRFNDCRHREDKGCAVREAAESGAIHMPRYLRYLKLISKMNLR